MDDLYLVKRADGLLEAVDNSTMEALAAMPVGQYIFATPKKATRSAVMNNCLHKYCSLIATALNDAGFDMLKVLKPAANIPWSTHTVKELLWRPVQVALANKESTTEATNQEYKDIHRVLDAHLQHTRGISAPWPNRFGD